MLLSQALKDVEAGKWAKIYAVVGEEPFQASEFVERLRQSVLKDQDRGSFNYDVFDAETVAPADLLASLDTLPGLFDAPDSVRLVVCRHFEKASPALIEVLEPYWTNPAPQTCFLILAEKIDKRKAWAKNLEKQATVIEVANPYDRDWPKWRSFFERRIQKKIDPAAWDILVESAQRLLCLVASECDKAALYVGTRKDITVEDVRELTGGIPAEDIFQLSEDIVARRSLAAMVKLHRLLASGESEIKILSIVLRHFRQIAQCLLLMEKGINDARTIGPQIGVPPFFVPKILENARLYNRQSIDEVIRLLAACDYRLKLGEGTFWGDFLVPHFQRG